MRSSRTCSHPLSKLFEQSISYLRQWNKYKRKCQLVQCVPVLDNTQYKDTFTSRNDNAQKGNADTGGDMMVETMVDNRRTFSSNINNTDTKDSLLSEMERAQSSSKNHEREWPRKW